MHNSQSHVPDAEGGSATASHPTPDGSASPAGPTAAPSPDLSSIGLFVLLVAASLPFIDYYIVNVALHRNTGPVPNLTRPIRIPISPRKQ